MIGLSPLPSPHPGAFQRPSVRPSIASYGDFSLDKGRSPGFASGASDCSPSSDSLSLRLTRLKRLTSPDTPTRRLIMQKARRRFRSDRSWTHGFRFFFNPLPGCFSPFPHGTIRYRSSGSIQPCGMDPADSGRITRVPPYSGGATSALGCRYGDVTLSVAAFLTASRSLARLQLALLLPRGGRNRPGLG